MRINADYSIHTWTAFGIESGEPILVDDRTFDPTQHVNRDPEELAYQAAAAGEPAAAPEPAPSSEAPAP